MTGKPGIDLEAEYNNRARCPDHPAVMARWKASAAEARRSHPPVEIAYGRREREVMDLFGVSGDRPTAVFLHGGYWQALDKGWFSGIAPVLLAHGIGLAVPSYELAPMTRLSRIVDQVGAATRAVTKWTGRRPLVFGHSAGGHMAAWLLAQGLTPAAVAISGVFDLEPLVPTSLNGALRLDAAEARRLSPIHGPAPADGVLDCVVGAAESPEFVRQSRDMADRWAEGGTRTRFEALEGLDHFTVLDPLFDRNSALIRRIVELARETG